MFPKNVFQKQAIMRRVLYSLVPVFLFAIYLYGLRVIAVTALVFILGIATEFVIERTRKKKVSEAVLVTSALYALSLPPAVPYWIAAVGIIFAVFIGKGVYGGFGRNIFNPAITGRLFIYIAFPTVLAGSWMTPATMTGAGAFGMGAQVGVDTITAATPLAVLRSGQTPEFLDLLLGFRGGSIGESSMVLIILAGIYLIATKTAQWRLIVSTLVSAAVLQSVLYFAGVTPNMPPQYALFSGSLMYISVWMVTDPVSGPNKKPSQLVYGLIIGTVTILVRNFAGFPEGTSFGILMGNVFASLLDEIFPKPKKKTAKKKAPSKTPAKAEPAAKEATA